jgi:DnaA family protein
VRDVVEQLPLGVSRRDFARFSSFVPGANREALAALEAFDGPRVMWLWGRPGSGKTHLLQAACGAAGDRGEPCAYVDVATIATSAVLDGCDALHIVCLDNIDAVSQSADWNAALFRLYVALQDHQGRLVVASRAPAAGIEFTLADLRSRLLAASIHHLAGLDESGQREALQLRAAARGLELSDDAALFLVHRVPRDMHTLFGLLDRLDRASLAAQRRLTIPFLKEQLEKVVSG